MNKFSRFFIFFLAIFITCNSAFSKELLRDEFIENDLKNKNLPPVITNTKYNYESIERIPIKLEITKKINTKHNLEEGDILQFKVRENVISKTLILKKGTIVEGRLKTYMTRGWNGMPGKIILDDFTIPNIDSNKVKSTFIKKGADLTLLVLPVKWALTPLPPLGSCTNVIIGGHGIIKPRTKITLYYYPNWGK